MNSIANTERSQVCALCDSCTGFEPHFWKQSSCAKCRHPISDHSWKKFDNRSSTISTDITRELYKNEDKYRVILYNDEHNTFDKVINQIKKAFKTVANQILTNESAEELAIEAHMNGGNCIFSGSESQCWEMKQILSEISLQCDVESPNHIMIQDEFENPSHNKLVVLHYSDNKGMTIGTLLGKLNAALGFNKDKAKYICHVTAMEGKINLYCGPLHQCVLISRVLYPMKTSIQDVNRVGLSLCDQAQLVMIKRMEQYNLGLLPLEVADSVFHLSLASESFKFSYLSLYLSAFPVVELNLSAHFPGHEPFLPVITDQWLEEISKCKTIQSLNLNYNCSKVTLNGLQHLSSLGIVTLSLENCALSDLDISKFPMLFPFLKHLNLANSKRLTTQCAPCFEQLHALEALNIQYTSINVSTEYLKQRMPQLKQINSNAQEEKPKRGRAADIFAEAFDRIRDKLPNQRDVEEDQINLLFTDELRLMIAQNPALLIALREEGAEDDEDDDEDESDDELDE